MSAAAVPATLIDSERPRPVRSASGTKVSGETGASDRCQRASASTIIGRRSDSRTTGW